MNMRPSNLLLTRPAWILAAALFLTLAGYTSAAELPAMGEPTYNGRPVAFWVAALQPTESASGKSKQVEAEEAIHVMGPDAIPFILQYRQGDRTQRLSLIRHACGIIGPEGEARIVEALNDSNPTVRETALEVLPKSALPAAMRDILDLRTDPSRSVRTAALMALVRLAPDHEETIAALTEALHDTSPAPADNELLFTGEDAALALGRLGPKAKSAVPELTRLLSDSNDALREAAAMALWKIAKEPSAVPILAECLENARDYQTCIRIMKALADIGPAAKPAVSIIRKKIDEPGVSFVPATVDLGQVAVDALAKIDPSAAAQARQTLRNRSPETE